MILLLGMVLWLVFGVMAASSLLFRHYHDSQILGITLSRAHARQPEVQRVVRSFQRACYLVLALSALASGVLLIPVVQRYAEMSLLVLVMLNLLANWCVISHFQGELRQIKEKNQWTYSRKKIMTVDLSVAREKGRSGVSPFWVWLFLPLSFAPMAVLLLHPALRQRCPLGMSLIGPLCQLLAIFLYYQMRNRHVRVPAEKTEQNLQLARREERINSLCATWCALAMLVFWGLFNLAMLYAPGGFLVVVPVAVLTISLLWIARWQQKKTREAEDALLGTVSEEEKNLQEDSSTWKWGCYHNPDDPRVFVPKRIAGMGWTINIGRPAGKAVGLGTLALIAAVICFVAYSGSQDYQITVRGDQVMIDAAMYDMTIERDQVDAVSVIDQLPSGTRTNGYGGMEKSYGHFYFDGYGACMIYVYNDAGPYIVMRLKGTDPGYVIVNRQTGAETQALYQTLSGWLAE